MSFHPEDLDDLFGPEEQAFDWGEDELVYESSFSKGKTPDLAPEPKPYELMTDTIAQHFRLTKAIDDLRELIDQPLAMEKLHQIEREIVKTIVEESRYLNCGGCLKLAETLVKRMKGE